MPTTYTQDELAQGDVLNLIVGDKRVTWEWIGEGEEGDYNPKDKKDTPYLRFSCDKRVDCGIRGMDWEGLEDASYCTLMPYGTPMRILSEAAAIIMEAIQDENYKRRLEELSWFNPGDFKKGKKGKKRT